MPPFRPRPRFLLAAALAAFALSGTTAAVRAAGPMPALPARADDAAALADARARSVAADEAFDALKRIATPGHLLDPPPAGLMGGLADLQAQYAALERTAAGYRATLGAEHPTLKGAEQVLADLRGQILDGAGRAAVTAQRDAARARAEVAAIERRLRATDVTGSIVPMPPAPPAAAPATTATDRAAPAPKGDAAAPVPSVPSLPVPLLAAAAAAVLAALVVLRALLAATRSPPEAAPVRIEPPPPIGAAASDTDLPDERHETTGVPILAALPLPAGADPADVLALFGCAPASALARAGAVVDRTLAAAAGRTRSPTVLIADAGVAEDAVEAAALAVAAAAAANGRHVLLVERHGRLRRVLASAAAPSAMVDVGGERRAIVRIAVADHPLALLTAVASTADLMTPARLPDLAGFDLVVLAGAMLGLDPDLVLLAVPVGADPSELAVAIEAHADGRPCGALVIGPAATPIAEVPAPSDDEEMIAPRYQPAPVPTAARLGLRRSFDPARRRA